SPFYPIFIRRRPPRSPLFPYTTLFRSASTSPRRPPHAADARRVQPVSLFGGVGGVSHRCAPRSRPPGVSPTPHGHGPHRGARARDRKSTRLNSSHVSISYAALCMKKKK